MSAHVDAIVTAAEAAGATVLRSPAATIIVIMRAIAGDPEQLLPLADAARAAATSVRVVRDAIRAGTLPAVGRQRDRAVRRRDLDAWIATRTAPVARIDEGQGARVERRLARAAKRRAG